MDHYMPSNYRNMTLLSYAPSLLVAYRSSSPTCTLELTSTQPQSRLQFSTTPSDLSIPCGEAHYKQRCTVEDYRCCPGRILQGCQTLQRCFYIPRSCRQSFGSYVVVLR